MSPLPAMARPAPAPRDAASPRRARVSEPLRRQFGIEGFERILLERRDDDAEGIRNAIAHGARSHGRTGDDRTLLVIRVRDDEEVDHGT